MEGFLKQLRDDLADSDSAEFQIVDDNYNNSISSLPVNFNDSNSTLPVNFNNNSFSNLHEHRKRRNRRRRRVRRNVSTNSISSNENNDLSETSSENLHSPLNKNAATNQNKTQLSERMERHRKSRWAAAPFMKYRHSPPPPTRKSRGAISISSINTIPGLPESEPQSSEVALKTIDNDERDCHDHKQSIPPSSAIDYLTDDSKEPHSSVIDQAIAISSGRKNRSMRKRVPSKFDSLSTPPSVPIRRLSGDHIKLLKTIQKDPALVDKAFQPIEKDPAMVDKVPKAAINFPTMLRKLPYIKCSNTI